MSQMTLTQEEMQEAVTFYLNNVILKVSHKVTKVEVASIKSASAIPTHFKVEMEKVEQAQQPAEKVTLKTPTTELGKGKGKGPLEAAIKN